MFVGVCRCVYLSSPLIQRLVHVPSGVNSSFSSGLAICLQEELVWGLKLGDFNWHRYLQLDRQTKDDRQSLRLNTSNHYSLDTAGDQLHLTVVSSCYFSHSHVACILTLVHCWEPIGCRGSLETVTLFAAIGARMEFVQRPQDVIVVLRIA